MGISERPGCPQFSSFKVKISGNRFDFKEEHKKRSTK
jgi:hypothetical protein